MNFLKILLFFGSITLFCISCESDTTAKEPAQVDLNIDRTFEANLERNIGLYLRDLKHELGQRAKNLSTFEAISFELVVNFDSGEIMADNIAVVAFLPFTFPQRYKSGDYTIECDGGTGDWPQNCDGPFSCAKLVKLCLEEGGCATICQNKQSHQNIGSVNMTYVP